MHDLRDWRWIVGWLTMAVIGLGIWALVILAAVRLVQSGWWPWVAVALILGALVWVGCRVERRRRP